MYTAESRALAILEYSVNVNAEDIPRALSIARFEIPTDNMVDVSIADLPGDWMQHPASSSTKNWGTALLKKAQTLVIKIPSVIIPQEYNYLINPAHNGIGKVKFIDSIDYPYDLRIKTK